MSKSIEFHFKRPDLYWQCEKKNNGKLFFVSYKRFAITQHQSYNMYVYFKRL